MFPALSSKRRNGLPQLVSVPIGVVLLLDSLLKGGSDTLPFGSGALLMLLLFTLLLLLLITLILLLLFTLFGAELKLLAEQMDLFARRS